jgi:hypothetical protein
MPATRELLTAELTSIEAKIIAQTTSDIKQKRIAEGADISVLKQRRSEIIDLLEQLQTSDAMHDPRILRG